MTVQEIHKEVYEDIKNLKSKLDECKKDFKRIVLKQPKNPLSNRNYPFSKSYDTKTSEKKNFFISTFTALKRSDWEKPIVSIFGIYSRSEGNYAVSINIDIKTITIYPPHFFKRYRERIIKDDLISNEDLIRQYFQNDWGFMATSVNKDFEAVYLSFENDYKNDKVSFIAATSQGYCFGEKQGDVNIIKTILSEDNLFENQKQTFSKLKIAFKEANKERYGSII